MTFSSYLFYFKFPGLLVANPQSPANAQRVGAAAGALVTRVCGRIFNTQADDMNDMTLCSKCLLSDILSLFKIPTCSRSVF